MAWRYMALLPFELMIFIKLIRQLSDGLENYIVLNFNDHAFRRSPRDRQAHASCSTRYH